MKLLPAERSGAAAVLSQATSVGPVDLYSAREAIISHTAGRDHKPAPELRSLSEGHPAEAMEAPQLGRPGTDWARTNRLSPSEQTVHMGSRRRLQAELVDTDWASRNRLQA